MGPKNRLDMIGDQLFGSKNLKHIMAVSCSGAKYLMDSTLSGEKPPRIGSEHRSEGSPDVRFAPQLPLAPPAPKTIARAIPPHVCHATRRAGLLGENHAFRKCVAQLPKHRGEERSQEQSEYRQQQ